MRAWIKRVVLGVLGGAATTFAIAWLVALVWPSILSAPTNGWQRFVLEDDIRVIDAGDRRSWVATCRDFKARCSTGLCYVTVTRHPIGARVAPEADQSPDAIRADVIAQTQDRASEMRMLELGRGPAWLDELSPPEGTRHRAILAGWPWPALGGWETGPESDGLLQPTSNAYVWRPIASLPALPLRPIWSGFILDTILFAALLLAPAIARAWRRRRDTLST